MSESSVDGNVNVNDGEIVQPDSRVCDVAQGCGVGASTEPVQPDDTESGTADDGDEKDEEMDGVFVEGEDDDG